MTKFEDRDGKPVLVGEQDHPVMPTSKRKRKAGPAALSAQKEMINDAKFQTMGTLGSLVCSCHIRLTHIRTSGS